MKVLLLSSCFALLISSSFAQSGNVGIGTVNPSDQLHTTGTVRHERYRGQGTRLVQMDSSGRMIVTGAGEVFSATPNTTIVNAGCLSGTGAMSTINVGGNPTAVSSTKIAVRVNITHPSVFELRVVLTAPNGTSLALMSGSALNGPNLTNTVFTDEASITLFSNSAQPPYTGKFAPAGGNFNVCNTSTTLASFGAIGAGSVVPNGTWTLRVFDASNYTTTAGTLVDWAISFSGPESFATAEQEDFIPKFSGGNLVPSLLSQGLNGNIGIRDPGAPYPLTLSNLGYGIVQRDAVDGVEVGTFANAAGGWLQTYSNHPLLFTTANAGAQMTLNTAGNLGIGVSAPGITARLHVNNASASLLQLENSAALASGVNNDIWFKTGNYFTGGIRMRGTNTASASMGFYTNAATSQNSLVEQLTIADNGNVGIGNPAPFYKLDVAGSINNAGNISSTGNLSAATVTTSGNAVVNGNIRVAGGSPAAGKVLTAISSFGDAVWTAPQKVSFRGYLPAAQNATSGATMYLNGFTEEHDESGAFNPVTGVFTAPVTGTYQFNVTARAYYYVSYSGYRAIFVGLDFSSGPEDMSAVMSDLSFAEEGNVSFSETVRLTAGATVSVRCVGAFGGYSVKSDVDPTAGPYRSSFSGHLVN